MELLICDSDIKFINIVTIPLFGGSMVSIKGFLVEIYSRVSQKNRIFEKFMGDPLRSF